MTRQDWQRPQVLTTGMTGWDDVGWDVTIMVFNSGQYDYIVILYVYIYMCVLYDFTYVFCLKKIVINRLFVRPILL